MVVMMTVAMMKLTNVSFIAFALLSLSWNLNAIKYPKEKKTLVSNTGVGNKSDL